MAREISIDLAIVDHHEMTFTGFISTDTFDQIRDAQAPPGPVRRRRRWRKGLTYGGASAFLWFRHGGVLKHTLLLRFRKQRNHLQRRFCGAFTGVSMTAADARLGLFFGVGGQQAKNHRQGVVDRHLLNPARRLLLRRNQNAACRHESHNPGR